MSSYARQLQTRLKEAGLYTGDIDGIAGKLTVKEVELAIARGICTTDEQKDVAVIHSSTPSRHQRRSGFGRTPKPLLPQR